MFNNLGVTYLVLRDRKKCLQYLNRAHTAFQSMGNHRGDAMVLNNLGMAYNFLMKDRQRAMSSFQEAIAELQFTNDRDSEAIVLDNIGIVCLRDGHKDLATENFDRAITLFRREQDAIGEARVLRHYKLLDEPETASSTQTALAMQ